MRLSQVVRGVPLGLALLAMTGCRHEPARVSQRQGAPGYPATAPAHESEKSGTAAAAPLEVPAGSSMISSETGLASWYGTVYDKHPGANGEIYDKEGMTAASRTIPLGALARVTIVPTGKTTVVRITDRGPFIPGRIVDLSEAAARVTGLYRLGVAEVRVEAFEPPGVMEPAAKWCVQIGAFLEYEDAVQLRNDLLRRYGTAKVIAFKGPTGSWVRLTLPVPEKERSAQIAATVRVPDPGVEAYLTRTN